MRRGLETSTPSVVACPNTSATISSTGSTTATGCLIPLSTWRRWQRRNLSICLDTAFSTMRCMRRSLVRTQTFGSPSSPSGHSRRISGFLEKRKLEGYDVVCFTVRTSPECSPLSCNPLAETIPVNEHCLLSSLEEAVRLIERGAFNNSEPGPYRIFAVYSCDAASPETETRLD